MDWLRNRTWQLGVAVVLAAVGVVLVYLSTVEGEVMWGFWLGLILTFLAFAIPLLSKIAQGLSAGEEEESG